MQRVDIFFLVGVGDRILDEIKRHGTAGPERPVRVLIDDFYPLFVFRLSLDTDPPRQGQIATNAVAVKDIDEHALQILADEDEGEIHGIIQALLCDAFGSYIDVLII